MSKIRKVLIHLQRPPIPVRGGDQQRTLGTLKYFQERKGFFTINAVAGDGFNGISWTQEQKQEVLKFVDDLFLYKGKHKLFDSLYSRSQRFYHHKLLRQQLPVDSDYMTPPGYVRFVKNLLSQTGCDVLWINYIEYAHLALGANQNIKTLIDIHDLGCQGRVVQNKLCLQNLKFDFESNLIREVKLLNNFDAVIINSHQEMALLKSRISSHKLYLVPHLVENKNQTDNIAYTAREFKYDLLFVGSSRGPNRDGINYFLSSIFTTIVKHKPDTRLALAGTVAKVTHVDRQLKNNVDFIGYVPNLSDIYLKSKVVICPLRYGAGTKVKLQEAMGYAIPIVTSTVGASGMNLVDGVNAFITDEPSLFAQQTLRLLKESELAQKFSEALDTSFKAFYSHSAVYSTLDRIFEISH